MSQNSLSFVYLALVALVMSVVVLVVVSADDDNNMVGILLDQAETEMPYSIYKWILYNKQLLYMRLYCCLLLSVTFTQKPIRFQFSHSQPTVIKYYLIWILVIHLKFKHVKMEASSFMLSSWIYLCTHPILKLFFWCCFVPRLRMRRCFRKAIKNILYVLRKVRRKV